MCMAEVYASIPIAHYFNFQFILYQRQFVWRRIDIEVIYGSVQMRLYYIFRSVLLFLLLSSLLVEFVCWIVSRGKLFAGRLILDCFFFFSCFCCFVAMVASSNAGEDGCCFALCVA